MFKLPFFSLLFLALLNLVTASSVTYWYSKEGYWYYHGEVHASDDTGLKTAVVQAYNDMVADVEAYNKAHKTTYKTPSMMTGIFDGTSVVLGSSVRGDTRDVKDVPADFPPELKNIMAEVAPPKCHLHEGLCAEPMALATYVLKKGKLPDSATSIVATYGIAPSSNTPSAQNPCQATDARFGCKDLLQKLGLTYFPKLAAAQGASTSGTTTTSSKPPSGKGPSSPKTPSQPKPATGKHRRAIADEIHSLLLMVRDLRAFDDFLTKREFLMTEEEYF